jgi:tRNA(Ile)-lysidine synthase
VIRLLGKLPHVVHLAFSGGVDSLAAAHFLKRGGRDVTLLHFNHGCEYSEAIMYQCMQKAKELGLAIACGNIPNPEPPPKESIEAYWRRERYKFLESFTGGTVDKVITCHHLDDAVESWVWSSLHGNPHLIQRDYKFLIRPFLLVEKSQLIDYAEENGLKAVDDPFNRDNRLTRNYIRSNLLPHAYHINPGLKKVIKKKYLKS